MSKCYLKDGEFIEQKEKREGRCFFCHNFKNIDYVCSSNPEHFFCEDCRLADPLELIKKIALRGVKDIIEDINAVMSAPVFDFFSPNHHPLVAVLYYSYLCIYFNKPIEEKKIETIIKKARKYELGSCGRRGVCGAIGGLGVAITTFLNSTEQTTPERNLSLKIVGSSLKFIAELNLDRCCKLSVYTSITIANQILSNNYNLPLLSPSCIFIEECSQSNKCPFGEKKND